MGESRKATLSKQEIKIPDVLFKSKRKEAVQDTVRNKIYPMLAKSAKSD